MTEFVLPDKQKFSLNIQVFNLNKELEVAISLRSNKLIIFEGTDIYHLAFDGVTIPLSKENFGYTKGNGAYVLTIYNQVITIPIRFVTIKDRWRFARFAI